MNENDPTEATLELAKTHADRATSWCDLAREQAGSIGNAKREGGAPTHEEVTERAAVAGASAAVAQAHAMTSLAWAAVADGQPLPDLVQLAPPPMISPS